MGYEREKHYKIRFKKKIGMKCPNNGMRKKQSERYGPCFILKTSGETALKLHYTLKLTLTTAPGLYCINEILKKKHCDIRLSFCFETD